MNNKYIWIYGENYALTSNNNSFCMWKHVLPKNGKSEILNYFVAEKNEDNFFLFILFN